MRQFCRHQRHDHVDGDVRVATAGGRGAVLRHHPRRAAQPSRPPTAAAGTPTTGTGASGAGRRRASEADVELSDEKVEEEFDGQRRRAEVPMSTHFFRIIFTISSARSTRRTSNSKQSKHDEQERYSNSAPACPTQM